MSKMNMQTYEEIINILSNYVRELKCKCNLIEDASGVCVEILDGDPLSIKNNTRIKECISNIQDSIRTINEICNALEKEKWYYVPLATPPQYIDD